MSPSFKISVAIFVPIMQGIPNSLETIIEYNGYWTHGNERIDKPDKLRVRGRKCKDQWVHDNKKYNKYYQAGYNVIVIYEKDYKEIRKTDIFKQYREIAW